MHQHGLLQEELFEALKRLLVLLLPGPGDILLQELVHTPGNRGSLLQESAVEQQKQSLEVSGGASTIA